MRDPPTLVGHLRFLCATNGKLAEVAYLKRLSTEEWVQKVADLGVKFIHGAPVTALRKMESLIRQEDLDRIWFVSDVDEYDVKASERVASQLGVEMIWSRPCFEVWLILHLGPFDRFLENYDKAAEELSRRLKCKWTKGEMGRLYPRFQPHIDDAVKRARQLVDREEPNPSSGMWMIIKACVDANK